MSEQATVKRFEASVLKFRPFREWFRVVVEAETVTDALDTLKAEGYREAFGFAVEANWIKELQPTKGRIVAA